MTEKEHVLLMYSEGCRQMAKMVDEKLFDRCGEPYWVGVRDAGGLCDFCGGQYQLTPEEMYQIIDRDMSKENFLEWWDWNIFHANTPINLRSWLMGCRLSESDIERISEERRSNVLKKLRDENK